MLVTLVCWTLKPPETATASTCPLAKSIYRDADHKGFELAFGPAVPDGVHDATATINHPQQQELYRFTVSQSSGYGSVFLLEPDKEPDDRKGWWMTFFNQDLQFATPLFLTDNSAAPKYVVIAQLGAHDYYQRRGNITPNTPPLLKDPMWVFDRCQT